MRDHDDLAQAMRAALDGLLGALDLEAVGTDRFRSVPEPSRFTRLFGGQAVALALVAAGATVDGKPPHSLHGYFADAGAPDEPLELAVDRLRDGRSMATRQVAVTQGDRLILTMLASFHSNPSEPERVDVRPAPTRPDEVPSLQDWVARVPSSMGALGATWVDRPPPVELRIGERPVFLGGVAAQGARSHWMRLAAPVGNDSLLHAALLAYGSDFLLLDMGFRSHPVPFSPGRTLGLSLDHSIWFHRPARFDGWHHYTQETVALAGHRSLVRGAIRDAEGRLVATTAQEVLVRAPR